MKRIIVLVVVAVALMLGSVASAYAASGTVVISADVSSKLVLTVPGNYNFGSFAPDAANPAAHAGNVNVRSNVAYTIARSVATTAPAGMFNIAVTPNMDGTTSNPKAPGASGIDWPQSWSLNLTPAGAWLDPSTYSATYTYTTVP